MTSANSAGSVWDMTNSTVIEHETMWRQPFADAGIPEPTQEADTYLVWSNRVDGTPVPGKTYHVIVRIGTDGEIEFDPAWWDEKGPNRYFAPMRFDYGPRAALALAAFLRDPSDECARFIYANRHNLAAALESR